MRTFIITTLAVVILAGLGLEAGVAAEQPTFNGKPLSFWLKYAADSNLAYKDEVYGAAEAIRQIGTNGIPFLLEMSRATDSGPTNGLSAWQEREMTNGISATTANQRAMVGFMVLGDAARDAVPDLIAIYEKHLSDDSQRAAVLSLGSVGPAAAKAVPSLLRGLDNAAPGIKSATIQALGDIHAEPKMVVPVLAGYLKSTEVGVRAAAILAIGRYKDDAKSFVPQFFGFLDDPDREIQITASIALSDINPDGDGPRPGRRYSISYKSRAYSYVAIFRMLCEINHCARKLHLPTADPVTERDLTSKFVSSPRLMRGGGALDTKQFLFGFSERGILRYIDRLHPFGNEPLLEQHLKQARLKSLVDKEQALALAKDWLTAIDVSVSDLEKSTKLAVEQRFFYPDATPTGSVANLEKVFLPIYDVTWTQGEKVAVKVSIYGPTKELLSLRQEDDSFSRRPSGFVVDAATLEGISDEEFLKYSGAELHDLLAKHANVKADLGQYLFETNGYFTNLLMQPPLPAPTTNPPSAIRK